MAIDFTTQRSRRALIAGTLSAVGGAVAATLAGTQRVFAAGDDGLPLLIGRVFSDARSSTVVANNSNNQHVLVGASGKGGSGVLGISTSGSGVYGRSDSWHGVTGWATLPGASSIKGEKDNAGTAVWGDITDAASGWGAVYGSTAGHGPGIIGESAKGNGAHGRTPGTGNGIFGESDRGRGGRFKGRKAQIRLDPSTATIHPARGARGDLFVDRSGRLWFCKGGTSWRQLA